MVPPSEQVVAAVGPGEHANDPVLPLTPSAADEEAAPPPVSGVQTPPAEQHHHIDEPQLPPPSTPSARTQQSYGNGYGHHPQYSSASADYPSAVSTPVPLAHESDPSPSPNVYSSPTMSYQPPPQSISRPSSGLGDRYGYAQSPYQEPPPRQPVPSKNSIVIKVGMVGDAQIGKTSLMVKYVEGSWDEDYIQTLGG